jgi:hypothetical protein
MSDIACRPLPLVVARVVFFSEKRGGRKSIPCLSSCWYMPHIVVESSVGERREPAAGDDPVTEEYLGVRFVRGPQDIRTDSPIECELELMYHPSVNYAAVVEGAEFSIREGAKVVGVGIVIRRFDGSSK